jgi:uncharacterized protein YjiK
MIGAILVVGYMFLVASGDSDIEYAQEKYILETAGVSYNLNQPKKRWDLPLELEEISGIAHHRKNEIGCIQDEEGKLYIYSLYRNEIVRLEKFGKSDDYEGIEIIGERIYVLESGGDVLHFELKPQGIGKVSKMETHLRKKNDAEGLGYDHSGNLLIACKEKPGTKKKELKKCRAIYRIDLPQEDFKKEPKYIIENKAYSDILEKKDLNEKKHKPFKPSGIAVHPKTRDVYIIASVGKMLVILNPDGNIKDLIPLNSKLFRQPEGICFAPNGDMFISSEGRGGNGYILKF